MSQIRDFDQMPARHELGGKTVNEDASETRARLLLVEDHDVNQILVQAMTRRLGYESELAADGIEAEIIDLRSIQPWDEGAVLESLARTHRLVIAHEAVEAFGVGAEIAARMADIGFDELDAPIVRVGAPFMPVPFTPSLEKAYIPDTEKLVQAARKVLA